jgi:hypothetical protein
MRVWAWITVGIVVATGVPVHGAGGGDPGGGGGGSASEREWRRAVAPDEPARQRALETVQRVFALEYAERETAGRVRLARRLLAQGMTTKDDAGAEL